MSESELECDKLNKINILHRASLRGLKKCPSCGVINGQRRLLCRNNDCDLRHRMLSAIKPFDPIQLITYNESRLFSLRVKEKLIHARNFVSIGNRGTALAANTGLISQKAVCFVESCKYDLTNGAAASTVCKHVKACVGQNDFAEADIYPLDKGILWNLNISDEQKHSLWDLYRHEEKLIHPIQRLNSSTFAVTCVNSKNFPAGRLHITVCADSVANKKGFYTCACKKLKIVVEPDNSVTMKKEICDHVLLLLAAILNRSDGKATYGAFLDTLQYLWMPTTLNPPIDSSSHLMDFDMSLVKCEDNSSVDNVGPNHDAEDIFNFSEELFAGNNIPDFSDIILDVNSEKLPQLSASVHQPQALKPTTTSVLHIKDPKLNININDEDLDLNFPHIKTPEPESPTTSVPPINFNENSLSVIEQFQLNDNINVSNDNIALAKDIETLNNLESQVTQTCHVSPVAVGEIKQESLLKSLPQQHLLAGEPNSVIIKSKCNQVFLNKSVIVKQSPVKIIKITTPGVIQKLPRIDKKFIQISKIDSSKIIVLNTKSTDKPMKILPVNNLSVTSTVPSPPLMDTSLQIATLPSLSYESWLDHIIEILNDSIILQDSNNIKHTFHVHEDIFSHFSKTFGFNNNRRLPNFTTLIKSGKHKGLIKYGWYFNRAAAVKRIFSTKNSKLELQRSSEPLKEGSFVPFFPKISSEITVTKFRPIHPKEPEHRVFIKFSNAPETAMDNLESEKYGLKLEWLPSAFPRSHFGLMTIEFCVYTYTKNGVKDNNFSKYVQ